MASASTAPALDAAGLVRRLPTPVLVLGREAPVSRLREALQKRLGPELVEPWFKFAGTLEDVEAAEVVLGEPAALAQDYADEEEGFDEGEGALVEHMPNLRWFQSSWAGVDGLIKTTKRRDYVCTRLSGKFGPQMAEYVLGWLLFHTRAMAGCLASNRASKWDTEACYPRPVVLAGRTLGVLGCGDIGQHICKVAKAFGMRTVGFKRHGVPGALEGVDRISLDLADVLGASDYVVSVLPSTSATRGLLDGDALSACAERKPIFINAGRGDVVSEASVLRALSEGWVSDVVLDVFGEEPLPASSPLWNHPRVRITPHVAAVSDAEDVLDVFFENLARYLEGEPLLHVANWDDGY